uniref:Uncharacterized protein n=1 Tax=Anguilla anguilla TaxID=7936 RepID=A0A0E9RB13_ANGAN
MPRQLLVIDKAVCCHTTKYYQAWVGTKHSPIKIYFDFLYCFIHSTQNAFNPAVNIS